MPDTVRAFLPPVGNWGPIANAAKPPTAGPLVLGGRSDKAAGQGLWSTFWQDSSSANQPHERCFVPGDGRQAVDRRWAAFADALPAGAQVIDLGCGAGVVGRSLIGHRSDVAVTGVDWADVPPTMTANLTIRRGVRMEDLPFDDNSFDAAVSLFGVEYGDMIRIAAELQRVLRPGAQFSFLVHHADSEILREGSTRRRALRESLSGNMKAAFLAGRTAGVEQQRQLLKNRFPGEPSLKLITDYFRLNVTRTRAERHAMWQNLARDLDPEICLLMHLERAAKSAAEMGSWLIPLLSAMGLVSVSILRRKSGEAIAWDVSGTR